MARAEITVRGGGILGLSLAWVLARDGARVRVIDVHGLGAGASGGVVGALAPHAPEAWNPLKQFQFESLIMAESWWGAVAAAGGRDPGWARSGRLQPVADAAGLELAQARVDEAARLWQGKAHWRVIPAGRAPWEPRSASGWLIEDTLSGRIAPRLALRALEAALRATGVEILLGEHPDQGMVVHATGVAGLEALSVDLGRKVGAGVKGQALVLGLDAARLPQIYAPGLHVVPHVDGTVAIGSTSENSWEVAGVDAQVEALHARAVAEVPALAGAPVLETWAGIRPRARSRQPLLGAWPGRDGHFVLNGGFKIGFGMAPKLAETMAALILRGEDQRPEAFRLEAL